MSFFKSACRYFAEISRILSARPLLARYSASNWISKTTIRKLLLGAGIDLRPKAPGLEVTRWRKRGKGSVRPVYGFTYFEGQVVKDQKEYPVLLLIHRLWKQGGTTTEIARTLNEKSYPSRMGKSWSWNAVSGIIERFKNGTVSLDLK